MKTKSTLIAMGIVIIGPMSLTNAIGQATVSDPFNEYANGSSVNSGLNGGTGWSGAWAGNGASGTVNNGAFTESGSGSPAFWRYFSSPVAVTATTTYYFGGALGGNWSSSGWWGDTITDGSGNQIAQLVLNNNFLTSQLNYQTFGGNTAGYTPGTVEDMVGELQWSGSAITLSVWASPGADSLPGSQAEAGAPTWVQTGTATENNIGGVLLQGFALSGSTATAQELAFGSTWSSVTAVPEPGTFGLLGAAAGMLLALKRSKSSRQG
jgi:hypothetical protein